MATCVMCSLIPNSLSLRMQTKLITTKDRNTLTQIALLDGTPSLPKLLAAAAVALCPAKEDFTCALAKHFLANSYHYNPSLFAKHVVSHCYPSFQCASGYQTEDNRIIEIVLRRTAPLNIYQRRKTSLQAKIVAALQTESTRATENFSKPQLFMKQISIEDVPSFIKTHPEQLAYKVYRQTNQRIKIKRTPSQWIITLK